MAIDIIDLPSVPAIIAPQVLEKKRRHHKATTIVIGTILILSDGSECVVAAFDANGTPLCHPIQN